MSLRTAHMGYIYQDLVTAVALVDVLLSDASSVTADVKQVDDDLFDDLTIIGAAGGRSRIQIKHTNQDRLLSQRTFTGDGRGLRIDRVITSILRDLKENGDSNYAILLRDGDPDDKLSTVLLPVVSSHFDSPVLGFPTRRFQFSSDKLRAGRPWSDLLAQFSSDELAEACARLTVHTSAPAASLNLREPGPAESVLLRRLAEELGAGRPPNVDRSPVDVAAALIQAATSHRAGRGTVVKDVLVPYIGLTTDFGAVSEGSPIEPDVAVSRGQALASVEGAVRRTAPAGGRLVLVGGPGVGKSWLCQELAGNFAGTGSLVARHHCWLGAGDSDRPDRVAAAVVIGSLLRQLEKQVPEAFRDLRPRFEASVEGLSRVLEALQQAGGHRQVVLVVDGLDHVDRVLGRATVGAASLTDPARSLVDELAEVRLPGGVCLIIASQPGAHLAGADPAEPPIEVPLLDCADLDRLAECHGLFQGTDAEPRAEIVELLHSRSAGNALYATYLCRYASRASTFESGLEGCRPMDDALARLRLVPDSANDLDAYYAHLVTGMDEMQKHAIGVLALCDFAVTDQELADIMPEVAPRLRKTLSTLSPVLDSVPGLGGLKVHHESFARFLLRDEGASWILLVRQKVAAWLERQGVYSDARAFRHLPALLAETDRYEDFCHLTGPDFVVRSITTLQPPNAIRNWIGSLALEAKVRQDWPTLIRCQQLRHAVERYEEESLPDSLMRYADVVVSLLGPNSVAERLVYEGLTTLPARWGLRLCAAVDAAGVAAPWKAYIQDWEHAKGRDKTLYGTDQEAQTRLAIQLGSLRLRAQDQTRPNTEAQGLAQYLDEVDDGVPFSDLVGVLGSGLEQVTLVDALGLMTDDRRAASALPTLADLPAKSGPFGPTALELASSARERCPRENLDVYLRHGIAPAVILSGLGTDDLPAELLAETTTITDSGHSPGESHIRRWMSLLALAQALDPSLPMSIIGELEGSGFYRAWLRFVVATVGLARDVAATTVSRAAASSAVVVALGALAGEASPFVGSPRACDLGSIHSLIHETVLDAVRVLEPEDLSQAVGYLVAIGDGTTTSLMGLAETGPLAINDLLDLLARASAEVGHDAVYGALSELRSGRPNAHSHYSAMADFELGMARICLAASDTERAEECWARACLLLAAYGGHKDPTLDDILDSIEDVFARDTSAGRQRLSQLRDLAYLVAQHTDGRSTRHYPIKWWQLATRIDPVAAATGACQLLLQNPGHDDARADAASSALLRHQLGSGDPVVLAALRLSVGAQSRDAGIDSELLERLEAAEGEDPTAAEMSLAVANNIAADYDDRPLTYDSNANPSIATQRLMDVVMRLGGDDFAPRPRPLPDTDPPRWGTSAEPAKAVGAMFAVQRPHMPAGPTGAVDALREYVAGLGYKAPPGPRWDREGIAQAIGWRIIEVALSEGPGPAKSLLASLSRELTGRSDAEVMAEIGEGLALRADWAPDVLPSVASFALAQAFTRIRGGGGWQTFAGRARIDLWTKAHALDPAVAEEVLASAVADTIAGPPYQTYGVTESVICALAASDPSGDASINCWDAAYDVIRERLPGESETADHVHHPTLASESQPDVDQILAQLATAGICRPMRTDIRSALLALTLLCSCRPALAQKALCNVLDADLGAGRRTWILEVVMEFLTCALLEPMVESLSRLAASPQLSVRVLAAQCLDLAEVMSPEPPVFEAAPEIRAALASGTAEDFVTGDEAEHAVALIEQFLTARLGRADDPPGLRDAVTSQIAARVGALRESMRRQLAHLDVRQGAPIPDAYFFDESAVEDVVQAAASGYRAALAADGRLVDPRSFESALSHRLTPSTKLTRRCEASRVPRPSTRPRCLDWIDEPVPWAEADDPEWPPSAAVRLSDGALITREELARVVSGPYEGWVQIALVERQASPSKRYPPAPSRQIVVAVGLEIGASTLEPGKWPLFDSAGDIWVRGGRQSNSSEGVVTAAARLRRMSMPLAGLLSRSRDPDSFSPRRGPGVHPFVLIPSREMITLLGLRSVAPALILRLVDDAGPGLICRQWSGFPMHDGTFGAEFPAVEGADMLLRPDMLAVIEEAVGGERLSARVSVDFISDSVTEDEQTGLSD